MTDIKREVRVQVELPEGLDLTEEQIKEIASEFEADVVDTVTATRAAAVAVKDIVVGKVEEVRPKTKVIPKVVR
jgi:ABC-type Fe3+ transport system substrate-binding protein